MGINLVSYIKRKGQGNIEINYEKHKNFSKFLYIQNMQLKAEETSKGFA